MKTASVTLIIGAIVLGSNVFAQERTSAQLIQQLNAELPEGTYQGKGYNHPCQISVMSDGENIYQMTIKLIPTTGRGTVGNFIIFANSRKHAKFEIPNHVGSAQDIYRTFVAVATNDSREGYRLIIDEKGTRWAVKAGALRGVDATCIISR